ncbi:phytanoyl-CoA dioxygenase family protein [Tahibacter harae]|uniref:Phytanoyl-CoA dioxygenase family protein n=1 Tax=Tahibacter harae TaxID=2963937 RepID=A0ABT1QXH8_9GAMM|nr:phytanoyl-CoA dioxygenase family protein [Tahibacter harae]MCQ4166978.1 phytanoyl-CoA dioxygenase family protein [Tahibacter harae]
MSLYDDLMRDGFVVVRNAIARERCEQLLQDINAFKQRNAELIAKNAADHGYLYRVSNLHLAVPSLADTFAELAAPFEISDRFFAAPTSLYTSLYYERGSEQDLHRDTPYFTTRPIGRYMGVWLALDDVDGENGPLMVVPGSHLLPPIDVEAMARELFAGLESIPAMSADGWVGYQEAVKQQCADRGMAAQQVHVSRGDVIIWHPELLHGGSVHINKERSRRSLVMHVTPAGTPVYHMDVFYDPTREVPDEATWDYYERGGRKIAQFGHVDFGHEYLVAVENLN